MTDSRCDYCVLTYAEMRALERRPVARCGSCKYMRRKVTGEHSGHTDYSRFWCNACCGWTLPRIGP